MPNEDKQLKSTASNAANHSNKIAKWMQIGAWLSLLFLLYLFFADQLAKQINPNTHPDSYQTQGAIEVVLKRNRMGHYVANGYINGEQVTFLLDTGATSVSIPESLAQKLQLPYGPNQRVNTANGQVTTFRTNIAVLDIGAIKLRNVAGNINPHMEGDGILLGMSALKRLELNQKGDRLTLRL